MDTRYVITTQGESTGVAPIIVDQVKLRYNYKARVLDEETAANSPHTHVSFYQDGQTSIIIIAGANDKLSTRDVYAAVPAVVSVSKWVLVLVQAV